MIKSGTNMTKAKNSNRASILEVIGNRKVSRKDIAQLVGLTSASVTILVSEMIEEGVIVETGETEILKKKGRRKTYIKLNESFRYVVGVNIECDNISISISDLVKNILDHKNITLSRKDITHVIDLIATEIQIMLKKNKIENDLVLGLGIGIVGIVDNQAGVSISAYGLWNEEVNIKKLLEEKTGFNVVLDNNVRALALAEADYHEKGDLIFVKYGPGIGASLIIDGEIYSGGSSNALEFGHMIVEIGGSICACGQRGCLETVASYKKIREDFLHLIENNKIKQYKKDDVNVETILNEYLTNNHYVKDTVNNVIKWFSIGLINLVKICDTKNVVIYGDFFKEDAMFNELKKQIDVNSSHMTSSIMKSKLGGNKSIGGISLAIKNLYIKTGGKL